MTKMEAKKLGTKTGRDIAERIWTETSELDLAEVAEKYRHQNGDVRRGLRCPP